jgi:hypothetical protein
MTGRAAHAAAALAVGLLVLAGCRAARTDAPRRTDAIIFSHDLHVTQMEFDCDTCHQGITDAVDLSRSYLPREATCLECHEEKKEEGECGFCHVDPKRPTTYLASAVAARVPHIRHQPPVAECATCHPRLSEPAVPGVTRADHASCLSCHGHKEHYAAGACETCHDDLGRFPVRPVASFSHEGNFIRTHGDHARTSAETCAKCHDQTSCADCHARTVPMKVELRFPEDVVSEFIHRGDYVSRHMIEARADQATCQRCHGTSFCDSCHTVNNLTSTAVDPRMPHPPGWSFPGSADFHGTAARRDIASCASCHDQGAASVCVQCHRVGGIGGNPHPASWLARHDTSEIASNGMCAACH